MSKKINDENVYLTQCSLQKTGGGRPKTMEIMMIYNYDESFRYYVLLQRRDSAPNLLSDFTLFCGGNSHRCGATDAWQ